MDTRRSDETVGAGTLAGTPRRRVLKALAGVAASITAAGGARGAAAEPAFRCCSDALQLCLESTPEGARDLRERGFRCGALPQPPSNGL